MTTKTCHPASAVGTGVLWCTEGRGVPEVTQESAAGQRRGAPQNTRLWILEEGVLVIDAAPAAVLPGVLVPRPGPMQPGLLPCLMDAQVRCIDQAALDDVGKVSAQVLEGHPGRSQGRSLGLATTHLPTCSEPWLTPLQAWTCHRVDISPLVCPIS